MMCCAPPHPAPHPGGGCTANLIHKPLICLMDGDFAAGRGPPIKVGGGREEEGGKVGGGGASRGYRAS